MNSILNKEVTLKNLGLIDYKKAWDFQEILFNEIIDIKIKNRNSPLENQLPTKNYLIFCEHPHVYTLGKSGLSSNLLYDENTLEDIGVKFYKINRGGDITYHGPGQIVGYPILDLDNFFTDIHKYLRFLEESVILTLHEFGIEAGRIAGLTGVWIEPENSKARKICALGVKTSRWVTMHGFAFNVNVDLNYFKYIVPCGIADKAVTSLNLELGRTIDMGEVQNYLLKNLAKVFEMDIKFL